VSYHMCHSVSVTVTLIGCHNVMSHDRCGRVVHRPCSSCISSVQEIEENSIEFSLSTQIRSSTKSSWLSAYRVRTK